jgi:hypothetical protein
MTILAVVFGFSHVSPQFYEAVMLLVSRKGSYRNLSRQYFDIFFISCDLSIYCMGAS